MPPVSASAISTRSSFADRSSGRVNAAWNLATRPEPPTRQSFTELVGGTCCDYIAKPARFQLGGEVRAR